MQKKNYFILCALSDIYKLLHCSRVSLKTNTNANYADKKKAKLVLKKIDYYLSYVSKYNLANELLMINKI